MWKTVKGYSDYEVSSDGQIRNKTTKKVLKPKTRWDGYKEVALRKNGQTISVKVHKAVASTYGIKGQVINHKNGNRSKNSVKNLQGTTSSENNKAKNQKATKKYQNNSKKRTYSSKA
jgi:hypothetical protein